MGAQAGQLALGVAGAVAGFFIGGPLGASIGFALGSAVGGYVFAESTQGPKLTDLRLQVSQYGGAQPWIFGKYRMAGVVMWQTDLVPHDQSSGGKGGGGGQTTTTYTASFAIRLCRGPISGVLRCWANGQLVDLTELNYVVYLGTEDQLPDPTMEAAIGANTVPGFRGLAYIVFTDFECSADYGNRIPNLEFEITTTTHSIIPIEQVAMRIEDDPYPEGQFITGPTTDWDNDPTLPVPTLSPGGTVDFGSSSRFVYQSLGSYKYTDGSEVELWGQQFMTEPVTSGTFAPSISAGSPFIPGGDPTGTDWAYTAGVPAGEIVIGFSLSPNRTIALVYTGPDANNGDTWYRIVNGLVVASGTIIPTIAYSSIGWGNATPHVGISPQVCNALEDDGVTVWIRGYAADVVTIPPPFDAAGFICVIDGAGNFAHNASYGWMYPLVVAVGHAGGLFITQPGYCLDIGGSQTSLFRRISDPGNVTVGSAVAAISDECGLAAGDIDVSDLPDVLTGFGIMQQASGRDAIGQLMTPFMFAAVESDYKVKFPKLNKAPVVTIDDGDWAARMEGEDAPPVLGMTRASEADLPGSMIVSYINRAADYQVGTESEVRQVSFSDTPKSIDVPVVMTASYAKSIASSILYRAYIERDATAGVLPRKYLYLDPLDVIVGQGRQYRIVQQTATPGGLLKMGMVPHLAALVQQPSVGAPGGFIPQDSPIRALTDLLLLDLPLIADGDKTYGFYAAMGPASAGRWPGASLQKSADGGGTCAEVASTQDADPIGETTDVLGDFFGGNVVDELNSVTILLHAGELASTTLTGLLNGSNPCVIGDEVLQYRDATLIDVDTYTLTGLLRGRRGTEWATGSHSVGDRFAFLPALDVDSPLAEHGLSRLYKPVTFGKTLASATAQDFTNTGRRLVPYAPVGLGGGVDGSDNVTLAWTRRTRIGGTWAGGGDVPLSESSEAYVVQIWDASYTLCARIIEGITTPTVVYSAADQTTDFGGTQAHIYFTVGQVGQIGLGIQARGVAVGGGSTDDVPLSPIAPYTSGPLNPPPVTGGPADQTVTSGTRAYTSGFVVGGRNVSKFTTGGSISSGSISSAEYIDPRMTRKATLALDSTGLSVLAVARGSTVSLSFPYHATLTPSTDYYWILEDKLGDDSPSGVLGSPSNAFIDLLLVP